MSTSTRSRGFTLLEVMVALAILGFALVVLLKSAAGSIFNAQQAHMMGVVTDLARAEMYEIEETLLKDGFSDTDQTEDNKNFGDYGWPDVHYSYKVEEVELPGWEQLQQLGVNHGKAGSGSAGSGSSSSTLGSGSAIAGLGSDALDSFQNSALGGMLSQLGGGFGGAGGSKGVDSSAGASFIQAFYPMVQQTLKVSIRKVTLTVKWQVLGSDRDFKVVAFYTDASAMDKVLNGAGSTDLDDTGSGSGAAGSGSGAITPKAPTGLQPPAKGG